MLLFPTIDHNPTPDFPQEAAVIQVVKTRAAPKANYVVFDCRQIENNAESDPASAQRVIDPILAVQNIFGGKFGALNGAGVSVEIRQQPKHGAIRVLPDENGRPAFAYDPRPGYLGRDTVIFEVKAAGKTFRLVATLQVVNWSDDTEDQTVCPPTQWKKSVGIATFKYAHKVPKSHHTSQTHTAYVFSTPSPTRTSLTVGSTRTKMLRIFAG